jgi:hypothetical protein
MYRALPPPVSVLYAGQQKALAGVRQGAGVKEQCSHDDNVDRLAREGGSR